ncbi:MAG: hypothetical protein Q7S40_07065 [Opitutaceae bacterium]|nr:hypothetical protein [Opitutaceae bacterium]
MKKKSSKKSTSSPALSRVPLKFQFPNAAFVRVSGSFNNWDPLGVPLNALGDGTWSLDLALVPGRYEYRLLVDAEWADVPGASETVENPFGGKNAVLVVTAPSQAQLRGRTAAPGRVSQNSNRQLNH